MRLTRRSGGPTAVQRAVWLWWLFAITVLATSISGVCAAPAQAAQFAEVSGSPFPVGSQPVALALGDFDGDGNLDAAAANQDAGTVTALRGYGNGQFAPLPATRVGA